VRLLSTKNEKPNVKTSFIYQIADCSRLALALVLEHRSEDKKVERCSRVGSEKAKEES
jgi:hypothetical protein